jgi:hypothetical protein
MNVLPLIAWAFTILVAVYLLAVLRRLRRAGHRDRTAERVTTVYVLFATLHFAISEVFPNAPLWVWLAVDLPMWVVGFVFLASRVRRHPQALFSPTTIHRYTRCRRHR